MRASLRRTTVSLMALLLVAGACTSNSASTPTEAASGAAPAGTGGSAIGFIFIGPKDDVGYNQAAYDGGMAVEAAFPDLEILRAENIPEDDNATRVMEDMVRKGAKIIFATSYGHLDPAVAVAAANPEVVVVQQGNLFQGELPPNLGTYFGTVYEPVFLAGVAAGMTTKTNKLGFVYAFPIPQTISNINAFELGARSVNPDAETITVSTSNWCDPGKQAEAASSLLSQGADVLTQHQDCTATVIKTAEAAGAFSVGYHADGSDLANDGCSPARSGTGARCTSTSSGRYLTVTSPGGSTTPTTGSATRPGTTRSCSRASAPR